MRHVIEDETLQAQSGDCTSRLAPHNRSSFASYSWFSVRQNASIARSDNGLAYLVVYNKEGLRVADTEDPHVLAPLPSEPGVRGLLAHASVVSREIEFTSSRQDRRRESLILLSRLLPTILRNRGPQCGLVSPQHRWLRSLRETQLHILQIGLVSLLIGLLGAAFLGARITTPIIRLKEGSLRAASGDLSSIIQVQSGDELEALAQNFNYHDGANQTASGGAHPGRKARCRGLHGEYRSA